MARPQDELLDPSRVRIGLACGDVADAVFPHIMDGRQRDKLALALVELTRAIRESEGTA